MRDEIKEKLSESVLVRGGATTSCIHTLGSIPQISGFVLEGEKKTILPKNIGSVGDLIVVESVLRHISTTRARLSGADKCFLYIIFMLMNT